MLGQQQGIAHGDIGGGEAAGAEEIMRLQGHIHRAQPREAALARTGGRKRDAAVLLGWGRNTLTRKIKELGMQSSVVDTGDDDAESDLLNGAEPAAVAAGHPTSSIAWAYLAEKALDQASIATGTPKPPPA